MRTCLFESVELRKRRHATGFRDAGARARSLQWQAPVRTRNTFALRSRSVNRLQPVDPKCVVIDAQVGWADRNRALHYIDAPIAVASGGLCSTAGIGRSPASERALARAACQVARCPSA